MRPIAELAREHGVSAPSIYLWVARGWLPASLVDRTSRPLRIDGEGFAQMLSGVSCRADTGAVPVKTILLRNSPRRLPQSCWR